MENSRKKLPIGIQNFEKIRKGGYYYVDKTRFVRKLAEGGGYYFLSRPRRFGKSLFLDTIRCAFEGRKELFEGLYLERNWDWDEKYPVIRFDFSEQKVKSAEELEDFLNFKISENANRLGVRIETKRYYTAFMELLRKTAETKGKQVVLLIDEYDKPILDNIENTKLAKEVREVLKGFYQIIKPADPYLRFVFLTGVSKFSKVSLFSGLNNLQDITLHPEYNEICGYTQKEFESVFTDRVSELVKEKGESILEMIKLWYNGYRWGGKEKVYNPFDILLFLSERDFRPFWFETGTPEFLIKLLMERKYYIPQIENLRVGEELIESFDVGRINAETLLFQTGYLTIREIKRVLLGRREYILTYPNFEVRMALTNSILSELTKTDVERSENQSRLVELIDKNDFSGMRELFRSFFASIPYEWYRKNQLSGYEGYYASIFYAYFTSTGFDVRVEDATSQGKIDMTVLYERRAYIFEFKVVEGADGGGGVGKSGRKKAKKRSRATREKRESAPGQKALLQIKEKRYWEKYEGSVDEIYIIGVEFEPERRNITGFEWEKIK